MRKIIFEAASVSLSGNTTLTKDGVVSFCAAESKHDVKVIRRNVKRNGRMEYHTDGGMLFTPNQLLRPMPVAPQREKIHDNGILRIEMTSKSFIVNVKIPISMENLEMEDELDDKMSDAIEILMNKKEEMACSIL